MVHELEDLSEEEFKDYIEKVLIAHYGEDNVEREVYLESQRIVDFKVETKLGTAMVEAKDNASDAIGAKGQVEHYAAHKLSAFAIVLYPEHQNEPDLDYFGDGVCFMEFEYRPDAPEDASLEQTSTEEE